MIIDRDDRQTVATWRPNDGRVDDAWRSFVVRLFRSKHSSESIACVQLVAFELMAALGVLVAFVDDV